MQSESKLSESAFVVLHPLFISDAETALLSLDGDGAAAEVSCVRVGSDHIHVGMIEDIKSFRLSGTSSVVQMDGIANPHSGHVYVKQRQPILQGLQSKAAKDESDAKDSQPALRQVVGVIFDVRIDRLSQARDDARHQSYPDGERPVHVMDESATHQCRGKIAKGADDSSPKLATGQARTARRHVIHARTYAARIAKYLANGDEQRQIRRQI